MSNRIGRNDPCHCGSGKKYKKCHWDKDHQWSPAPPEPAAIREAEAAPEPDDIPKLPSSPPTTIAGIGDMIRQFANFGNREQRRLAQDLMKTGGPALRLMMMQGELDAADKAVAGHQDEFNRLVEDGEAYMEKARTLFSEEAFAPLRFTAEDVQRAFESVGYPNHADTDQMVETLREAILHVASRERRQNLGMELFLLYPEYVKRGKFLDALIIRQCASATQEEFEDSNPFLFQMFSAGYDAWQEEQSSRTNTLLASLGIDSARLKGMSLDQIDELLHSMRSDPAMVKKMEALMQAFPGARAFAASRIDHARQGAIKLLEREDATALLLDWDEAEAWTLKYNEHLTQQMGDLAHLTDSGRSNEEIAKAVQDFTFPFLADMARAIFTPERIGELSAKLKEYRNEKYAAGEQDAVAWAVGAMQELRAETDPGENFFLIGICYASVRAVINHAADEDNDSSGSATV
jgi:DNA-binding transcriptional MerR regulator